jgi:tRNA pseudouridine55 synthase
VDGVLVCDKPAGLTSHDVVARVRRLAGQRRVGHGGTLDPPATGVLVLALGRATRLLPFLPTEPKRYLAEVAFGAETDTLDAAGTVTATTAADGVDEDGLRAALAGFLGPQEQVPPMVSAIKVAGERLYAKARRGEEVERPPRPIVIHELELLGFIPGQRPLATISVVCSGGTYVRSLAADLGRALGTLAHLASLRRTAVGRFTEAEADTLEELAEPGRLEAAVLDPAAAMASTVTRALTPAEASALATGRTLDPTGRSDPVAAVGPDGRLVAVIQDSAGRARPKVVLA